MVSETLHCNQPLLSPFRTHSAPGLVSVQGSSVSALADFTSLSSQLAKISPSSTDSAQYNPTHTTNLACPTVGGGWEAASKLPPTPDEAVCNCLSQSLSCVPKPSLSNKDIGSLLGTVCGLSSSACSEISANGTTGVYGEYSMCGTKEQLAFALNSYYKEQKSASSACDFSGSATLASATASGSCSSVLSSASASGGGGGSGSSGAAASGTTSSAAAPSLRSPGIFGIPDAVQVGFYVVLAISTGLLMIVL